MLRIHPKISGFELGADSWVKGCWAYLRAKYPALSAQPRYHSLPDSGAVGPLVNDTSNPPQLWPRPRGDSTDFELTEVLSLVCSVLVASSASETKKASACSLSPGRRLDKGSQTECSVNFLQIASFHPTAQHLLGARPLHLFNRSRHAST